MEENKNNLNGPQKKNNNNNKKYLILKFLNIVKNESYSIIKAFLLCFNNHRRRAF